MELIVADGGGMRKSEIKGQRTGDEQRTKNGQKAAEETKWRARARTTAPGAGAVPVQKKRLPITSDYFRLVPITSEREDGSLPIGSDRWALLLPITSDYGVLRRARPTGRIEKRKSGKCRRTEPGQAGGLSYDF